MTATTHNQRATLLLTGQERLVQYEQRMAELRQRASASPVGNPGWCRDFERYARALEAAGPAPSSFGFSVLARKARRVAA